MFSKIDSSIKNMASTVDDILVESDDDGDTNASYGDIRLEDVLKDDDEEQLGDEQAKSKQQQQDKAENGVHASSAQQDKAVRRNSSQMGNREIQAPLHELRAKFSKNDIEDGVQFAQVVGLDVLESISSELSRNADFKEHGPGLPTAIAVHAKFIVIGTSRSLIMIFDHFQQMCRVLSRGKPFDKVETALRFSMQETSGTNYGPVSAMDVVVSGATKNEFVVAGYSRGRIELWDIVRCSLLRVISEGPNSHTCAISCIRFVGTGGPKSNRFEANGKVPFATVVSTDTSGVVNMLIFNKTLMLLTVDNKCLLDGAAGQIVSVSACEEMNLVALSSRRDTFIASLDNGSAQIIHRWPIEGSDGKGSKLPRVAWGVAKLIDDTRKQHGGFTVARAFGKEIKFLKTHEKTSILEARSDTIYKANHDILSLEWLNDTLLVYLDDNYDLCVLDVSGMAVIERTNVKNVQLVWTAFNSESFSFQNSVRASGSTLYLLGIRQLSVARVQTWTQRVETLIVHNGWVEALALALDHYELTNHRDKNKMCDLVMRFVTTSNLQDTQLMAAACIEYCVEIEKTDLLFDTIYDMFCQKKDQGGAEFLHLLEPYILNRLLTCVRPNVLQDFVNQYILEGKAAELEQCILHLDPDTIRTDLHTLVSVCKENRLFSGLVYLYNAGLNDFETPAKMLLELGQIEMLLSYLDTSFRGLTYPFGFPMDDEEGYKFVRVVLLGWMLENLKPLTREILGGGSEDSITKLIDIFELGLGNAADEWELRVILAIKTLDTSEAVSLCTKRLLLHPLHGLEDRELVADVLQNAFLANDEDIVVRLLRNCDPDLLELQLFQQIQGYGWNRALSTLHESALESAIKKGSNLLRIQTLYEQIIQVSVQPIQFVREQLGQHENSPVVRQALETAVLANLSKLSPKSPSEELDAQNIILALVKDPSPALNDHPHLQYLHMKSTYLYPGQQQEMLPSMEPHMGRFIELLCEFDPEEVLRFTQDNDGLYPLDVALEVCKRYNIRDATAYLLERAGDVGAALEMLKDSLAVAEGYTSKRDIVISMTKLCERNSLTDLDTRNAESLWFKLLEAVSNHVKEEDSILRQLLDSMMAYVESETILTCVKADSFGQLRHTVKCMIDAKAYEKGILISARKLASHDLISLVVAKHDVLAKGSGTVEVPTQSSHAKSKRVKKKKARESWERQMQSLMPRMLVLDPQ